MRINNNNTNVCYDILENTGLIRELHVYGLVNTVDSKDNKIQHRGFGKKLMKVAEDICIKNKIKRVAVISGVGVRDYYKKLGYSYNDTYMVKELECKKNINMCWMGLVGFMVIMIYYIYNNIF